MKKGSLVFLAFLLSHSGIGQERAIELSSRITDNRTVEITYLKNLPGTFTIAVQFSNLTNTYQSGESVYSVFNASGTLLTLKPQNTNQGVGYRYIYNYIRGKLKPKVNRDFCYILPYTTGTKVRVVESAYVNEKYFGAEAPAGWKSYAMFTDEQDTVIAIRKGMVVDIVDKFDNDTENIEYTSRRNYIIVEQEDGTLLRYSGFQQGSITVKTGETVVPGTALGMNIQRNNHYQISLLLYYLNSADFESLRNQTLSRPKSLYEIVTPMFALNGDSCTVLANNHVYIAFNNEAIITREMSKKELKRYHSSGTIK